MMLINVLMVCLAVHAVVGSPTHMFNLELNDDWILFKSTFNKSYDGAEIELSRRLIWEENVRYIQKHNLEYDLGQHTYTTGINHFSDMTNEEFRSVYLPNKFEVNDSDLDGETYMPPLNAEALPVSVDWRKSGYVTGVKNQGQCGSCWSFSTTGSLEGQHFRKYGKLISLSEQQLVDCSGKYGNYGCNGGTMSRAVNYITANKGIQNESSYIYRAVQSTCKFNLAKVVATTTGYVNIPRSEISLANSVANVGPVSIAIDASHPSFQHYRSGIYYEPTCSTKNLDHAVLIVGYGKDTNNRAYWIVKNSWASAWGNGGYIYMAKDRNNQCGVASMAGYPRV